jgi:hypothetical protein
MDDLVVVDVVRTEPEAELLRALLRSAGIESIQRVTNVGAGVFEGLPGGPQEILVRAGDLEAARQVLQERD